jgi:hypothetical protein
LTPKKDAQVFEPPALTSSSAGDTSQVTPILQRLKIVDLLSFELVDGKVETHGFAAISLCSDSSFLRYFALLIVVGGQSADILYKSGFADSLQLFQRLLVSG